MGTDIFGKARLPLGGNLHFTTFQEVFEELIKATFEDIEMVLIGRGYEVETGPALLTINSALLDDVATEAITVALEALFYAPFEITSTGTDVAKVRDSYNDAITAVVHDRLAGREAMKEKEAQDIAWANRPYDPAEYEDQQYGNEEWRLIRDPLTGMVTDTIWAD